MNKQMFNRIVQSTHGGIITTQNKELIRYLYLRRAITSVVGIKHTYRLNTELIPVLQQFVFRHYTGVRFSPLNKDVYDYFIRTHNQPKTIREIAKSFTHFREQLYTFFNRWRDSGLFIKQKNKKNVFEYSLSSKYITLMNEYNSIAHSLSSHGGEQKQ